MSYYVGRTTIDVKERDGNKVPLRVWVIGTERGNKESAFAIHLMETEGNEVELNDGIEIKISDLKELIDGEYTNTY